MPDLDKKTIKDEDGNEVEVYDATQVEEALKETEQKFGEEKGTLEKNLKEATEKLEKVDEKDKDFSELRDAKEKLEKDLKSKEDEHEKTIKDLNSKLGEQEGKEMEDYTNKAIELYVGDDKDTKDKIDFHIENSLKSMPRGTKEEVDALLKSAFTLATGQQDDDKISNVLSSAGDGGSGGSGGGTKVKPELVEAGKNFGLNDEDFKNAEKKGVI